MTDTDDRLRKIHEVANDLPSEPLPTRPADLAPWFDNYVRGFGKKIAKLGRVARGEDDA